MKIALRADAADGTHTRFTVFINGANCGQLCMLEKEAVDFYFIVHNGCNTKLGDEFLGKGKWIVDKEEKHK